MTKRGRKLKQIRYGKWKAKQRERYVLHYCGKWIVCGPAVFAPPSMYTYTVRV